MGMSVAKGDDAQLTRLNARFLEDLANRGYAKVLAAVDMATGQLPLACQGEALLDEEHLVVLDDEAADSYFSCLICKKTN